MRQWKVEHRLLRSENIKNEQEAQVLTVTFAFSAHRSWRRAAARLPQHHPWCPCAQACAFCAVLTMALALPFLSSSSLCGPRRGFRTAGRSCRSGTGHSWLPWREHPGSLGPAGDLRALCSQRRLDRESHRHTGPVLSLFIIIFFAIKIKEILP